MNLTELVARIETWEDIHTEFKERSIAVDNPRKNHLKEVHYGTSGQQSRSDYRWGIRNR
jgi:hypothetical protein